MESKSIGPGISIFLFDVGRCLKICLPSLGFLVPPSGLDIHVFDLFNLFLFLSYNGYLGPQEIKQTFSLMMNHLAIADFFTGNLYHYVNQRFVLFYDC